MAMFPGLFKNPKPARKQGKIERFQASHGGQSGLIGADFEFKKKGDGQSLTAAR